jgi:hypothetical protein
LHTISGAALGRDDSKMLSGLPEGTLELKTLAKELERLGRNRLLSAQPRRLIRRIQISNRQTRSLPAMPAWAGIVLARCIPPSCSPIFARRAIGRRRCRPAIGHRAVGRLAFCHVSSPPQKIALAGRAHKEQGGQVVS